MFDWARAVATAILLYDVTAAVYFVHCCGYRERYDQETPGSPAPCRRRAFQLPLPVGGATNINPQITVDSLISIHAPRGGERRVCDRCRVPHILFQSTLPVGGSDSGGGRTVQPPCYFNPRSPWGGDCAYLGYSVEEVHFNPRSPWGGATMDSRITPSGFLISIHAPRGGERLSAPRMLGFKTLFQSTLPVGGATWKTMKNRD